MKGPVLFVFLLAGFAAAGQRIRIGPADVAVDPARVDLIAVPDEKPVTALAVAKLREAPRVYGISGDKLFVVDGGKARVVSTLPGPARTLVALSGGRLLAGSYLLDTSGRLLRDYGLKAVYAAAAGPQGRAYAVTYPEGEFFVLEERAGPKGRLYQSSQIGVDEYFRAVPRALAVDGQGTVWTSGELGYLYRYRDGRLEKTGLRLPAEKGREFLNVVQAMVADSSGVIYGGTSDGYLFRLDPDKPVLENLGKPVGQPRIRALAVESDGSLLGMAGDQLFAYRAGTYQLLGRLEYRQPEKPAWMAYEVDSLVIAPDGAAYLGESEYRAHLFVLRPAR